MVCQKELQAQIQELDRLKKIYTDEETVAMDAREKASAAEEKSVGYHFKKFKITILKNEEKKFFCIKKLEYFRPREHRAAACINSFTHVTIQNISK